MSRIAGTCRYVYNRALAVQQESHMAEAGYVRYAAMAKALPISGCKADEIGCGYTTKENRTSQARFCCIVCEHS